MDFDSLLGPGLGAIVLVAIAGAGLMLYFVPMGLWISALFAGVRVSLFDLVGMRLRRGAPPPNNKTRMKPPWSGEKTAEIPTPGNESDARLRLEKKKRRQPSCQRD